MSYMKDVVGLIYENLPPNYRDGDRWIDTKSGWQELSQGNAGNYANQLLAALDQVFPGPESLQPGRRNTWFSVVDRGDSQFEAWRKEEALERLIVASNSSACNQWLVAEGKEAIDIVYDATDGSIRYLVELKHDPGGGTPTFALAELLKNHRLYRRRYGMADKKQLNLVLLAPPSFFSAFSKEGPVGTFFCLLEQLADEEGVTIELRQIGVSCKRLQESIRGYAAKCEKTLNWTPYEGRARNPPYRRKAFVDATNLLHDDGTLKADLAWDRFTVIETAARWPQPEKS